MADTKVPASPPHADAPAVPQGEYARLLLIVLQILGVGLLIWLLRIESPAFYGRVMPLVIGGAVVNHALPSRLRPGWFAALSLLTIWAVFGVTGGTWIIGIGLVLIGICHLPIAAIARTVLLVLAAGVLVAMRARMLPTPFPTAIWAIVGSMFMFRLILYVYDLRHARQHVTWDWRLAYFFCVPNVAFPLFPVIDFTTFRRTHYDRAAAGIYESGIAWMLRGVLHLVLYRMVYQYFAISPVDVRDATDLTQYVVANYGLYLRVSGQFHLVVGVLHLFGFRLPETHRFFYLASSLTDFWRRINIYWKDFMQKVFYMPVFFRVMRRHGETTAMIAATLVVVAVTWFFHGYQWFWILGVWLWSATDALFWSILGVLLLGNALLEARRGRTRTLGTATLTRTQLARHGMQTALMFALLCSLWGMWTSPSLGSFVALIRGVTVSSGDVLAISAVLLTIGALAALNARFALDGSKRTLGLGWTRGATAMALACVAVGAGPAGERLLPKDLHAVLAHARDQRLNARDEDLLQRGYYEQLTGVNTMTGELWSVYAKRPADWATLREQGAERSTRDARLKELVPGAQVVFLGAQFTVNADGLRDRTYTRQKPDGVLRAAILGQSYVMGSGVRDDQTFENVLEDRLTRTWAPTRGVARVEILNFGGPSFTAQQQRASLIEGRVGAFEPDIVLVVGHRKEVRQVTEYVLQALDPRLRVALPDTILAAVKTAGVTRGMLREEALQRLAPYTPDLLGWVYRDMADVIHMSGARAVFAHIPMPMEHDRRALPELLRAAKNAGFDAVVDLDDVFSQDDERALVLAEWDRHPNTRGHQLIAERLERELLARPDLLVPRQATPGAANSARP